MTILNPTGLRSGVTPPRSKKSKEDKAIPEPWMAEALLISDSRFPFFGHRENQHVFYSEFFENRRAGHQRCQTIWHPAFATANASKTHRGMDAAHLCEFAAKKSCLGGARR